MFKLLTAHSRVAIIGAGPAGLCAAAQLKHRVGSSAGVRVFERAGSLGGTWRYTDNPSTDAASSMYANLRTNLPVQCMAFPDFPFQPLETSFPGHREILAYLANYADYHQLDNITFNSPVTQVTKERNKWTVETTQEKDEFDFVIVANGHYTKPSLPEIFKQSAFQGSIIHSHVYRRPEHYRGKRTLVIGVGPSGTDISIDLLPHAERVALLGSKEIANLPDAIAWYQGWPAEVRSNGVVTTNGDFIESDAIIVSSGYEYDFSFLPAEMASLSKCAKKVHQLYRQIVPVNQPTLGCIGVPSIVVPFPLIHCQVAWLISLWTGVIKLPSLDQRQREAATVPGIGGELDRHFHKMGTAQWSYNDQLALEAGCEPIPRSVESIYKLVHFQRREFGPVDYRQTLYTIDDDDSFTTNK